MARRGARASLDRATVVQAAAELSDAAGVEVTLSALAAHLGVQPPSLYNHVAGQEGLRRELAMLGLGALYRQVTKATVGRSGAYALRQLAQAYLSFARVHPGLYPATLRAPDPGDAELLAIADDIVSVLVAVMASAGLAGEDAIHAIRGFRSLLHGFITLEAAGGFDMPVNLDSSFEFAVSSYIEALGSHARRGPQS